MFNSKEEFVDNIEGLLVHLGYEKQKTTFFKKLATELDSLPNDPKFIREHLESVVKPSSTLTKEFTYKSSIINLYGYLESFIEKLSEEYISIINEQKVPVSRLPEALKSKNFELSLQYLSKMGRNKNLSHDEIEEGKKEMISNLNLFLSQPSSHSLNAKAFSSHSANFRLDLIKSHFSQLGVSNLTGRLIGLSGLKTMLGERRQEPSDDKHIVEGWIEGELNDLAQLRNEIAHGAFSGSIESIDLIISRAKAIKEIGKALGSILELTLNEVIFNGVELCEVGVGDRFFSKQQCIGFFAKEAEGTSFKISVGCAIYAKGNANIYYAKITELRENRNPTNSVTFPNSNDFTMKLDRPLCPGIQKRKLFIR